MLQEFSLDAAVMEPSPIRKFSQLAGDPEMISFAGGFPANATFPIEQLQELFRKYSQQMPTSALQYGQTKGNAELISFVVQRMRDKGIDATTSSAMTVSGSQRGLDLIGRVLFDPGDTVLIESPSYPGAIAAFRNLRVNMIGVPMDDEGVDEKALEEILQDLQKQQIKPKAFYTIPNFQNPSGKTLVKARREIIAELSQEYDFFILEDDPYGDIYFDDDFAESITPIAAWNTKKTIYMSSFSKILFPGLRTGFINGPKQIIDKIELAAQASDLCFSSLDQQIIAELCQEGVLDDNLPEIRRYYAAQAALMLQLLDEHMPAPVTWNSPQGGFFLWLNLPAGLDSKKVLERAIERKILYVPGEFFVLDDSANNSLRLSFSKETPERMTQGIATLSEVISSFL